MSAGSVKVIGGDGTMYYSVDNPEGKSPLYISVRGVEDQNEFAFVISNPTVGKNCLRSFNMLIMAIL